MAVKPSQLTPATTLLLTDLVIVNASGITKTATLSLLGLTIQGAGFQFDGAAPNNLLPIVKALATGLTGSLSFTNVFMALVPKGAGGVLAALPDSTLVGGNPRGLNSVDWQTVRVLASQVAAALESTISGGRSNSILAVASDGTISGGFLNSIVAGSLGATIGGGSNNSINAVQAPTIGGGQFNTMNTGGNNCTIAGGSTNSQTGGGNSMTISGGTSNVVGAQGGTIPGGEFASTRAIQYMYSYAGGRFSVTGDAQLDELPLRISTPSATPVAMSSNGATADATTQYTLANNSCALVTFEVAARDTATGNCGAYTFTVLAKRGASAAATSIVGAPTVVTIAEDAGFSAADFAVTADTTNGSVRGTFTGIAATTTHAAARVRATYVQ